MSRGKTLTPDDIAMLKRMVKGGYSDADIAKHIGVWRETVTNRRLLLGLSPGRGSGRQSRLIRRFDPDGEGGETSNGSFSCLGARILLQS